MSRTVRAGIELLPFAGIGLNEYSDWLLLEQHLSSSFAILDARSYSDAQVGAQSLAQYMSDGQDGDCVLDGVNQVPFAILANGVYHAQRIPFPNNMVITSGSTLNMRGFHGPYGYGELYVEEGGLMHVNGLDASGATAGAAFAAGTLGANSAGAAGGVSSNGTGSSAASVTGPSHPQHKYTGGTGGAGGGPAGTGGTVNAITTTRGEFRAMIPMMSLTYMTQAGVAAPGGSPGSGGGGGGGGASTAGGGGGSSGGYMHFGFRKIINSGTISADGGHGGDAGAGTDTGSGASGGGGKIIYFCSEYVGNEPLARGGNAGRPVAATGTGRHAQCGLEGEVVRGNPMNPLSKRLRIPDIDLATLVDSEGNLDVHGGFYISTPNMQSGSFGCGFNILEATGSSGKTKLRYDGLTNQLHLEIYSTGVLSTSPLGGNPASPTFQNWTVGDYVEWRVWHSPALTGSSRATGIRMAVNGVVGVDTVTTGSGGAIQPFTSGYVMANNDGSWRSTNRRLLGPTGSNVTAHGVILGDSLSAPRILLPSPATFFYTPQQAADPSAKTFVVLAQGGGTVGTGSVSQRTVWQASRYRGDSNVEFVVMQLGSNDLVGGLTSGVLANVTQYMVSDIKENNPNAKMVLACIPPARAYFLNSQYLHWSGSNELYRGNVADQAVPVSGADAVCYEHVLTLGDGHGGLRYRGDSSDAIHTSRLGRKYNGWAWSGSVVLAGARI